MQRGELGNAPILLGGAVTTQGRGWDAKSIWALVRLLEGCGSVQVVDG